MNLRATEHLIGLWVSARACSPNRQSPSLTRYLERLEAHRDRLLARQEAKATT